MKELNYEGMVRIRRQIHYDRKMLNVQRLTGTPKLRSYNLAEHSYFVGLLFMEFAEIEKIDYTKEDLSLVFRHDFLEVLSADLPYHVKNLSSSTKEAWEKIESEVVDSREKDFMYLFTDEEMKSYMKPSVHKLMKACDILELYLFCREDYLLGNHSKEIKIIMENCKSIEKDYGFKSIIDYMLFLEDILNNEV